MNLPSQLFAKSKRAIERARQAFNRQAFALLAAAILPRACLLCEQACGDRPLCDACRAALPGIGVARCARCGLAMRGRHRDCHPVDAVLQRVTVVADYASPLAEAITALKFGDRLALAAPLGRLLAEQVGEQIGGRDADGHDIDCLVPIPLSDLRLAERGFNQAQLTAELRRRWPASAPADHATARRPRLAPELLDRRRNAPHQSSLGRAQRRSNLRDGFNAAPAARGLRIMLVDDVMTTGATLEAAAIALTRAGATTVSACVVARTP